MNRWYKASALVLLILYSANFIWMLLDWKHGFGALPWWGAILEMALGVVLITWCAWLYQYSKRQTKR
jgi:hypothetical protein